jgi:parallel beta helix pectate lyase-like protein/K319-like protein
MSEKHGGQFLRGLRPRLLLLALVFGACLPPPAAATIIHVPGGHPTVRLAAGAAAHGDTILVAPGTHNGGVFVANKSLTIASQFLVTGDTALVAQTVLNGVVGSVCGGASGCLGNAVLEFGVNAHGSAVIGLTLSNGENGVGSSSIVSLSHCRIVSNADGVDYVAGSGGTLEHSVFENNTDDGIDLNGRMNMTIRDNVIRNNGDDGIEFRLLSFSGPEVIVDMTGNTITGNGEDGIQIIDYPEVSAYVMRIDRNIFAANFDASGNSAAIGLMPNGETVESLVGAAVPERVYVTNNTFIGEKNGLVGGANVIALNNVFVGTQGKALRRVGGNSIASYSMFWNNLVDYETSVIDAPHMLQMDPALGPSGELTAGSPAIDSGTASFQWMGETVLNLSPSEYVGSAPDMGADEFGSSAPPNAAPTVNAGPDQSISFPGVAGLVGTVSDDSRPDPPGAVAVNWSVLSGAGPMVIQDPSVGATWANFSRPGTYVLRLTASDGALMTADTVQITVVAGPNAPPVVDAGPDRTITLPASAALDGTVSDDGLPNPPSVVTPTWSVVSGPGGVTFANPYAVDTQASFTVAGTYILRLVASDGLLSRTDSMQVTVSPVPNTAPVVDAGPNRSITLPAGASLDGTVTDDGLPNPPAAVTTTWSKGSGPGGVTFVNANAVDTQASFTVAGTYILRLTANDGALSTTDSMQVTALPPPPPIDRRIAAASDDAEEDVGGGISSNTSDIELVFSATNQTVGLRFTNVTVPPGATITSAYIQFEADETQSEVTNLTLKGQAADNAATFTTVSGNVSARPRTTAAASWSPVPWTLVGEAGVNQRTPELKTVIQEIVNRPGWASGNALAIIITGTGHRTARSFENVPAGAALLHIEAGPAPPSNLAPVVDAGPDRTITLPADAALDGTVSDDGLPNPPGGMTTTWTVGSGPGGVSFQNANQVDTPVTFTQAGTYILRLTANDGALSTTDSMQFIVHPVPNSAPFVDAGTNRAITLPASAALDGTVNDDGLPNPPAAVTTTWSKGSGPGGVSFVNANAVDTQASFTMAGTYILRLTANDGALSTTDSMQVTVSPSPNTAPVVDAGPNRSITLPAGAALDGTVSDDGLPNPPGAFTTTWTVGSGPGGVTFLNANAVDTQASFAVAGTYILRLTANDGALSATDSVQVTVLPPPAPIERRIATGTDDAEEPSGGFPNLSSADIELVFDSSLQTVGLRFTNVAVPPGATITSAYIQFEADEVQSEVTNLTLRGQAADNPTTFASSSGNVSARPQTTASASWSPAPWTVVGEAGANQRTPELKTVIQEIVNRPGWASGNALAIIVTGTGHRTARAFDGVPASAALLHIEASTMPPSNAAPVVDAGPNRSITLPASAALDGTVSDDGLPNPPAAVTTTWSKGSGPGTVTFVNANAVDTQASFTVAGTYILRLTANDGALSTTDSMQVTVSPVPNTAPVVDAGPNRSITLPASAALDGTVSDDGLPNPPAAVTTTWSKGSGPGTVTFVNANAVDTQASFTVAGTYILRLTANDGALSTTDSMQVTVSPMPNTAPVVDAGPNRSITLPAGASLDGTVSDDGLPNPPTAVTTTWSKGSGPGTVTFVNANAVDTQASFTVAGTYILRLTANDGALSTTDSMQVTVSPVPNTAPVVDAGSNGTITLPAGASLDGTVTDDGLPNPPAAVTTTWSKGSGPGGVSFVNANAVDTQASFTVDGTYILRLTANDGALSATDSVQVTVQPDPNTAPVVNAGADQTVVLPASAVLDGTVSDDGLPAPPSLSATWSVVSGPGPVTFQNANLVDTQASFTTAGVYVLQLAVGDGRLSTADQVQITAQAVAAPLERRVASSSDDAEESASGTMNLTSTNLDLVFNTSNQTVGLRFTGLAIPAGSTITRAYIQFTSRKVDNGATSLTIRGQTADNPGTFTGTTSNLSSRPRTTAAVIWAPSAWGMGDVGAAQQTPELKAVVQEIVNRPGWASGNALAIVITGTGVRVASSYDMSAAEAALLHVEYATAGAPLLRMRAAPPLVKAVEPTSRFEFALHRVGPNPTRGELSVEFSLADHTSASVELIDIAGRRVAVREVGSFGPGRHRLELKEDVPAGVYLVRLAQGTRIRLMKVAVLR